MNKTHLSPAACHGCTANTACSDLDRRQMLQMLGSGLVTSLPFMASNALADSTPLLLVDADAEKATSGETPEGQYPPISEPPPANEKGEVDSDGKVTGTEIDAESNLALVRKVVVRSTPTTIFLDKGGFEIARATGAPKRDQLQKVIASL